MIDMCLEALISGVISVNNMNMSVDTNNGIFYTHENRVEYVLPDKFNLIQLCEKEERFAVNAKKPFDLIKTID
jgi:hypothetical protein